MKLTSFEKKLSHFETIPKYKSDKNWEIYRKQRNLVTKIKRDSIKTYFYERTAGGPRATSFYPTIKPFLSGKTKNSNNNIVLCENDSIVNDQQEVSKNFNEFFINVAKDIGDKSIKINKEHPSVMKISKNNTINNELNFKNVSEEFVTKQINKLNVKKATGHDGISPKILKMAQQEITNPITKLVNKSIDSSIFPADLKSAQVSPLYKKK